MIWKFGESYLLFLKKADKIRIKHVIEYDQNIHIHLGPQVLDYMKISLYCKF